MYYNYEAMQEQPYINFTTLLRHWRTNKMSEGEATNVLLKMRSKRCGIYENLAGEICIAHVGDCYRKLADVPTLVSSHTIVWNYNIEQYIPYSCINKLFQDIKKNCSSIELSILKYRSRTKRICTLIGADTGSRQPYTLHVRSKILTRHRFQFTATHLMLC